jgi:Domain of unknown function (DUF4349)
VQYTTLRIQTAPVEEKTRILRALAAKQGGRISNSVFNRDPNGRESANLSVRLTLRSYPALMQSLKSLGKIEDLTVKREDRANTLTDEGNAPAEVFVEIYSQGNLVSGDSSLLATLRHTVGQGTAALMWSLKMIGVAIAFLLPWAVIIYVIIALVRRARRIRGDGV